MNYYKKFNEYIKQQELFPLEKEHIILISGGKDSNALITLIEEYKKEQPQVKITYLNITFPQNTSKKNTVPLTNYTRIIPEETDEELDKTEKPCERCKNIRINAIEQYLKDKELQNIIIHTGHTTDDIIAYFTELCNIPIKDIIRTDNITKIKEITIQEKDFEHFSRHLPKIVFQSGITLAKPLLKFNRREINEILQEKNITHNATCCEYAYRRPKRNIFEILNKLPKKEVQEIYNTFSLEQMQQLLKERTTNYKHIIKKIQEKKYKKYVL